MFNPNRSKNIDGWWDQFPLQLQLITKIRFLASLGAGGVIYLTSLIFNSIGLSATEIGLGFTISAIIGTVTRAIAGDYLNKENNITLLLRISSLFSIIASLIFIFSNTKINYLIGQSFIGAAAGIYWPSVEFAVPNFCHPINRREAYALVRSSEALGILLGVFYGSILSLVFYIKFVYIIDLICMILIIDLIADNKRNLEINIIKSNKNNNSTNIRLNNKWNKNSGLIITAIILITTCLALIQVTLPLDFVLGGIKRSPITDNLASYLISLQLIFLLIIQWPIGKWISKKGRLYGLKLSLFSFGISSLLLFSSSYFKEGGIFLMLIAIFFCSIATSSFLPSSTDIVFQIAPLSKKGSAFALLSQCFAMGYFLGPFISGSVLDYFGNASIIWFFISISCLFMIFIIGIKKILI